MSRLGCFVTSIALVAAQSVWATEKATETGPDRVELRHAPCAEEVRSIRAQWFDDEYRSFVRGWTVPRRHWKAVLEAVRACTEQEHQDRAAAANSANNSVHLRIVTEDGRQLLIVTGSKKTGNLKAFPYKGCKEAFLFAQSAAPFLRKRLGDVFRQALKEKRSQPDDQRG